MGSCVLPAPFWLLLLLLPLQLPGAEGRPQGLFSRGLKAAEEQTCNAVFDLYFILDISGSINNNWMDVYNFVEDLVNKFKNPKLRMSFILYSTDGFTLMPLTSDRKKIERGLKDLQTIIPEGSTFMQEGFKKANEQIEKEIGEGKKVSSMIIAFTDGTLEPKPYEETKFEAQKARSMGATVYGVGVKDYEQSQLEGFADSKDHAFGVTGGFSTLTSITDRLAERSCIELKSVDPITACVGEEYQVVLRGSGFLNAQDKKLVICRFKFSDNSFSDETAISVEEKVITCPGVDLEEPGESIAVEVSLNNGISFFSNNLKITGKQCGKDTPVTVRSTKRIHTTRATEAPPEVPPEVPPETTIETETTTETTTHAVTVRVIKTKKFPVVPVLAGVVGLLALLLLLLSLWRLCSWCKKKPPPPPEERVCPPPCPIVIRRCCACFRCGRLMHMEERCLTLTPVRSPCTPMVCRPSLCLPPCREQVPFPNCPPCCYSPWSCSQSSRMLPLVPPCSRALPSCPVQALPPEP